MCSDDFWHREEDDDREDGAGWLAGETALKRKKWELVSNLIQPCLQAFHKAAEECACANLPQVSQKNFIFFFTLRNNWSWIFYRLMKQQLANSKTLSLVLHYNNVSGVFMTLVSGAVTATQQNTVAGTNTYSIAIVVNKALVQIFTDICVDTNRIIEIPLTLCK